LFRQLVEDRVAEAMKGRAEIQAAPDNTVRAIQEQRYKSLEARLKDIRLMGDAVIAAFFVADKPRAREVKRAEVESWLGGSPVAWDKLAGVAATLKQGVHPLTPFHWQVEFPKCLRARTAGLMQSWETRPLPEKTQSMRGMGLAISGGFRLFTRTPTAVLILLRIFSDAAST
jgi:hypothetical protein